MMHLVICASPTKVICVVPSPLIDVALAIRSRYLARMFDFHTANIPNDQHTRSVSQIDRYHLRR